MASRIKSRIAKSHAIARGLKRGEDVHEVLRKHVNNEDCLSLRKELGEKSIV